MDAATFIASIETITPIVSQLLYSKSAFDVAECVDFFVVAYHFKLDSAAAGLKKMLLLVCSQEENIRNLVVKAYQQLYLGEAKSDKTQKRLIAKNLANLTLGTTLGEQTALEELIVLFKKQDLIPPETIHFLWEIFQLRIPDTTLAESRGALTVISMLAGADPEIVHQKLGVLVNFGLGERWKEDEAVAKTTCIALQKLRPAAPKNAQGAKAAVYPRIKNNHPMFIRLGEIILDWTAPEKIWYGATEQALNVLYVLAEQPDLLAESLLRAMASNLKQEEGMCQASTLGRFLFALGHIGLKQLVHNELAFADLVKSTEAKDKAEKKTKGKANETQDAIEKELGEEAKAHSVLELESKHARAEYEIVHDNLIGQYLPLVDSLCDRPELPSTVRASAILCMSKLMCVSKDYCESHLQLLFTLANTEKDEYIRANIVISMGDMAFRFPNVFEPWTAKLYSSLQDPSARVRKNVLMVLTHLILNDMIKIKGNISEMALRLEDPEPGIAALARRFFFNLSKKGNAIYNILPDCLSNLSQDGLLSSQTFQEIMKFLIGFIQKDRQNEALVDKLCQRFRISKTERQYRDIGFCLALLNYNDKAVKKLKDHFALYKDHMHDELLYNSFQTIIQKAKREKGFGGDMKSAVEDLESAIMSLFRGEDGKLKNVPSKPKAAPKRAQQQKKRKVGYASSDEDDDSLSLSDDEEEEVEAPAPAKTAKAAKAVKEEDEVEVPRKRASAKAKKAAGKAAPKKAQPKRGRALRQKNDSSSLSVSSDEGSEADSSPVRAKKAPAGRGKKVSSVASSSSSQASSPAEVPATSRPRRAASKRN